LWANPVLMVHAEAHWPIQAGLSLLGTGEAVSKGVRDACCRMSEGGLRSTGKAKLARATHRACGERRSPFAEVLHGTFEIPLDPHLPKGGLAERCSGSSCRGSGDAPRVIPRKRESRIDELAGGHRGAETGRSHLPTWQRSGRRPDTHRTGAAECCRWFGGVPRFGLPGIPFPKGGPRGFRGQRADRTQSGVLQLPACCDRTDEKGGDTGGSESEGIRGAVLPPAST